MRRSAILALCAAGVAVAVKDADTIVFATFGDWGWSPTAPLYSNVLLTGTGVLTGATSNCTSFNIFSVASYSNCLDGDKVQQGTMVLAGFAQTPQIATANAMASVCTTAGGCDFLLSTGDHFYDLGIVNGAFDSQWDDAYANIYNGPAAFNGQLPPVLATLGNHDYSIINPRAAAAQIAYTGENQWYMPAHNYAKTFKSVSGNVAVQVVEIDSTPLHDRYLFSGGSGGSFATDVSGTDIYVNAPNVNAVLNTGITAANGWTPGNGWTGQVFNASNFACGSCDMTLTGANGLASKYNSASSTTNSSCGYDFTTGAVLPGVSSGCKYASAEIAPLAHPAARAATYTATIASLKSGYGAVQHQVMFSHFPVLSAQQRLFPFYENITAMFATLGPVSPQAYYNGHDHILTSASDPAIVGYGSKPITFVTSGAAGITDFGKAVAQNIFNASIPYPASGYLTLSSPGPGSLAYLNNSQFKAAPSPGKNVTKASYNPDVQTLNFWSEYNGFTITTVNATWMKIDYYLVDCSTVMSTGNCNGLVNANPVYTTYQPAKTTVLMSMSITLNNLSITAISQSSSQLYNAIDFATTINSWTINNVVGSSSSVTVTFTGNFTTSVSNPVATQLKNVPLLTTSLAQAGLAISNISVTSPVPAASTGTGFWPVLMTTSITVFGLSFSAFTSSMASQLYNAIDVATTINSWTINNVVGNSSYVTVTFTGNYTDSLSNLVYRQLQNVSALSSGLPASLTVVVGTPTFAVSMGTDFSAAIPGIPAPSNYDAEPHFDLRIGLGIGLGLGLPITLVVAAVVYSKLPEGGVSISALLQRHSEAARHEAAAKGTELTDVNTNVYKESQEEAAPEPPSSV